MGTIPEHPPPLPTADLTTRDDIDVFVRDFYRQDPAARLRR